MPIDFQTRIFFNMSQRYAAYDFPLGSGFLKHGHVLRWFTTAGISDLLYTLDATAFEHRGFVSDVQ